MSGKPLQIVNNIELKRRSKSSQFKLLLQSNENDWHEFSHGRCNPLKTAVLDQLPQFCAQVVHGIRQRNPSQLRLNPIIFIHFRLEYKQISLPFVPHSYAAHDQKSSAFWN